MTARPVPDDRDPLPAQPWQPVSSEHARRAALQATWTVDRAREKRTTVTKETT